MKNQVIIGFYKDDNIYTIHSRTGKINFNSETDAFSYAVNNNLDILHYIQFETDKFEGYPTAMFLNH
jgi:hypothetical protein